MRSFFFFFNDTATTEIYTLSLHDALPIFVKPWLPIWPYGQRLRDGIVSQPIQTSNEYSCYSAPDYQIPRRGRDRKSTRLNSSHANISYAVFCLKKKKKYKRKCLTFKSTSR